MTAVVIFQLSGCSAIIDAISVTGDVVRSGARVMGKYLDTELRKLALKLDSRIINDVR